MNNQQKNILIDGVKNAGFRIRNSIGDIDKESMTKVSPFDYGIPADKEAEKIIIEAIEKSQLNCQIISEESQIIGDMNAEYRIYVDPLDGSVNFSRGIPVFCIGVGIYKNNVPVLGIVYDICMNELLIAEIGNGIRLNDKKIAPKGLMQQLLVNLEWFGAEAYEETIMKLKRGSIRARTAGSGILALCYGCIGRGDGAILLSNSPWDIAPGMVFAKELGLTIQQLNGKDVDLSLRRQDIIVASSMVFQRLKEALN